MKPPPDVDDLVLDPARFVEQRGDRERHQPIMRPRPPGSRR
jgi:hypothetical protein